MTTSIVNQIAELLLPLIFSDVQVTRTDIQVLQDQLRSLLALKMVLVPDALIHCLSDIVIKRPKQRTKRLPDAMNLQISRYLPIRDAGKYLVGTNLPPGQIKNQMKKRWEQIKKEYQKLIKDGKYSSWRSLIVQEYKRGRTLKELIPFITAQNIPDQYYRSEIWRSLIEKEYKKGRTLKELIPFITAQNIPNEASCSVLWRYLIDEEYKRGRALQKLIPFITEQNVSDKDVRSVLWRYLIEEEYEKGRTLKELIRFITAQNIPNEVSRSVLWRYLIEEEYKKGRMSFDELIPFITAVPYRSIRSVLWRYLIEEEYKKGRMSFDELIPFITAQNIPNEVIRREILWGIKRK
jgi:predicted HAD superfamily phosphohydrolase